MIWADTSDLVVQPDKTKPAMDLYDRGELGSDTTRRVLGFAESDAPSEDELASWAFKKLLSNAQLATAALEGLGIDVPESAQPQQPQPIDALSPAVSGAGEQPQPADASSQGPPNTFGESPPVPSKGAPTQASIDHARLLVLEGHVCRALDVARNRVKGGSKTDPLDGTFTQALATLGDLGFDPVLTVKELKDYCRTVLDQGVAYDRACLDRLVRGTVDCADCGT